MSDPDLTQMTEEELAKYQAGWKPESHYYLLAQREWQRRAKAEQQAADHVVLERQMRLTKFSMILTAVASIIAAIAGAVVGAKMQSQQPKPQEQTLKLQVQLQLSSNRKQVFHKIVDVKVPK